MLLIVISLIFVSSVAAADLTNDHNDILEENEEITINNEKSDVELTSDENLGINRNDDATGEILTSDNASGQSYSVNVKEDMATGNDSIADTTSYNIITDDNQGLSAVNIDDEEKISSALDNSTHYGYWLWNLNIPDLNLTKLADQGVTDLILNYYAFEKHDKAFLEDLFAAANEKGIHTHIWVQIFFDDVGWTRPISRDGVVNYEFFNERIEEIKDYINTTGVYGIHYDYLRFSGTEKYNNAAYQNPGGMEAITYFVNESAKAFREINPDIVLSAAIMPEYDYLAKWYGVDYPEITKILDAVVPMIYTMNFHNDTQWVKDTTKWFVENSNGAKVWTGLQAYTFSDDDEQIRSNVPTSQMNLDISASLEANASGVILFRFGQCNDIDFNNLSINESEFDSFSYLNYIISTEMYHIISNEKIPVPLKIDFAFDEYFDSDFVNGILILRDGVKVDGANHLVDAKGVARILNISRNNVTLMNFRFANASAVMGAIYVAGNGTEFINCTFISDTAVGKDDVVRTISNSTEFINCTFIRSDLQLTAPQQSIYTINYDGKYNVILKDSNRVPVKGKTVTFVLNGKNIASATTDASGAATIKIASKTLKNAKSGKKNLVIKFSNAMNQPASKTVQITINKEKTKLTAKSKTFKRTLKTKKYTIVLKNSKNKAMKNVKVTLKIKGKTYKAKTNSKGKATFKIKKLTKKGTFKAKIKYAGNNYYKAVSKTIKIKNK